MINKIILLFLIIFGYLNLFYTNALGYELKSNDLPEKYSIHLYNPTFLGNQYRKCYGKYV